MKNIILILITMLLAIPAIAGVDTGVSEAQLAAEAAAAEANKDPEMIAIKRAATVEIYTRRDCPVVGNRDTGIYHMPGQVHYKRMLEVNKCVFTKGCKDNRVCFDSAQEADGTSTSKKVCPKSSVSKCTSAQKVIRKYIASKAAGGIE